MNRKRCFMLIIFLISVFPVYSEKRHYSSKEFPVLSSNAQISMVTVYPGTEVYSLFGHSSFRVYDPEKGIDWMFNYGTFDFDDPLFLPKFVKGQLDYYLAVDNFQRALRFYSDYEGRKVTEQVLNLDYAEKKTVFNFLLKNSLPENKYYKYDFVNDNCSTRIADVLIKCFGDNISFPEGNGNASFRKMIDSYLADYPLLDAGIEIVLGSPADRIPSGIEKFFLPVPMIAGFDNAVLKNSSSYKKLVSEKLILNRGENFSDSENDGLEENTEKSVSNDMISGNPGEKTRLSKTAESVPAEKVQNGKHPDPLLSIKNDFNSVFYLLLLFPLVEILHFFTAGKKGFVLFRIICSSAEVLFLAVSGAAGLLLSYLWFFSDHIIPNWNFHILWLSPLAVLYVFTLLLNKGFTAQKYLSRVLFISSLFFILILVSGIQSISFTLLPMYLYSLLLFWRKGHVYESDAVNRFLNIRKD